MVKWFDKKRCKLLAGACLLIFISGIVYLGYFCPEKVCALSGNNRNQLQFTSSDDSRTRSLFNVALLHKDYEFNTEGDDVMVFLHIQKTAGTTFGRHLVTNMDIEVPCKCFGLRKRCDCKNSKRNYWLFSRYSTGWACGLHADWTELQECVDGELNKMESTKRNRRYLYVTILREPISRYLSEWQHVSRGATWITSTLKCNGRSPTVDEVPFCFEGKNWKKASLDQFLSCSHNLAENRQTRMLANLSLVDCYDRSRMEPERRRRLMLASAKENLASMAFFGLAEHLVETQHLFERTFGMKFSTRFEQFNETHSSAVNLTSAQRRSLADVNALDLELYRFAKELFFQRVDYYRNRQLGRHEMLGHGERLRRRNLIAASSDRHGDKIVMEVKETKKGRGNDGNLHDNRSPDINKVSQLTDDNERQRIPLIRPKHKLASSRDHSRLAVGKEEKLQEVMGKLHLGPGETIDREEIDGHADGDDNEIDADNHNDKRNDYLRSDMKGDTNLLGS